MIVASCVAIDGTTSKELLQSLKSTKTARSLCNDELRPNLPAEANCGATVYVDAEAALAVDHSRDPAF